MVKVTRMTSHGVRVLLDLVSHSQTLAHSKEIALRQGISHAYIENILTKLKKANLVQSTRGPHGGYRLARSSDEITMADVIRTTEGSIRFVACVEPCDEMKQKCERIGQCVTRTVWSEGSKLLMAFFDSVTMADLSKRTGTRGLQADRDVKPVHGTARRIRRASTLR